MLNKIKLVQIIADSDLSGGPKHVLGILDNIDKDKFDLYLICPAGYLSRRPKKIKGVEIYNVAMGSKFDLGAIREMRQIISKIQTSSNNPFGPMIIHTHGPRAGLLGREAAPKSAKLVYTEHRWDGDFHLESRFGEWLQLKILKKLNFKTDLVIAVSSSVKRFLVDKKIAPKDRVIVIPNGININKKSKIKNQKYGKNIHKNLIIGSVGSLNKQKGFEYLIEAMPAIIKRYPGVTLEIIGEGGERANLKSQISNLKVERHVTLLGRKENPINEMKEWDIFVLPSIAETFGIVILEAYLAGIPVVASKVGGILDVVRDKKSGVLIEAKKPYQISEAVIALFEHPALAAKLKRGGREQLKKFDWEKVILEIEKEYIKIVQILNFEV